MKVLTVRKTSKLIFFTKIFFAAAFAVFIVNIYFSSESSQIINKIRNKNLTIQGFQDKFAEIIQRGMPQGQVKKSQEELDEKERAEQLGLDDGITDEARRIMQELNITDAGEYGVPVIIPETASEEIKNLSKTLYAKYLHNALASSMVSLNRAVPDNRSEYCRNKVYPDKLPKASVVIQFHDDDWMLLMRTVHSVLLRTPDELLEEILLIYDLSDREYYKERLDDYISKFPKIRLIRSHTRQGIISARILGARNAKGPIIFFLDSHVEVAPGWIEPMLARIDEAPNAIMWPKVTGILSDTLGLDIDEAVMGLGSFKWTMEFTWMEIDWYEGDKPTPRDDPKPSVTFIGPCFGIRKDFLFKIGLFDPEFDIWGGEDVELSFRAWMCGGRVELIPCSVVAHMFKDHTYSMQSEGKGGFLYNFDRIAEIWLEDYKKYYYAILGDTRNRYYGDISERLELKEKLGCKSFKWFIENIHPKMPIPEDITGDVTENVEVNNDENMQKEEEEQRNREEQQMKVEEDQSRKEELKKAIEEVLRKKQEEVLKSNEEEQKMKEEEQIKVEEEQKRKEEIMRAIEEELNRKNEVAAQKQKEEEQKRKEEEQRIIAEELKKKTEERIEKEQRKLKENLKKN